MGKDKPLIVVALGGNALVRRGQRGTYEEQLANLARVAPQIAEAAKEYKLLLTHGNGPQVGALCLQQEAAKGEVPPQPLHVCVAMTQAQIGYMIQTALSRVAPSLSVAVIVTRVLVDPRDPAFSKPTKPIGPYYSRREAERLAKEKGWTFVEVPGRGYRRVVPSPRPLEVVDLEAVKAALKSCDVVVAGGGGGIPVIRKNDRYVGVDAVIDKDLTSALLAISLSASRFVILTDVDGVYVHYRTPKARMIRRATASQMKRLMAEGHFPPGSMGPKVEAAVWYVESTRSTATIGCLESLLNVLRGSEGTLIKPD